ncbi:regulatory LuxR family protein [Motilibacter peucedani]|uniref:Regulatory LuxR family protein n=1 Tax=Motilibacter peucedani TaxID=598650 RepID=A0A420XQL7_9ACTN|nr:LuxR C-terminal-related transcriptional regulator [Motilibacter peucedani]RKS75545.1 regulatory LuxR family protein [Motilibacter peucedani]
MSSPAGWLSTLGLSDDAGAAYVELVREPAADAVELAGRAGLEPGAAEAAVRELQGAGLLARTDGALAAASPDLVLGARVAEQEARLREARAGLRALDEMHRAAVRFPRPADVVELVVGADAVAQRFADVQRLARTQLRGFDKPPYLADPAGEVNPDQAAAVADGVRVRTVYDRDAAAWPGRLESDILVAENAGEESRVAATLPVKLMIADDRAALIPLSSTDPAAAYLVHPGALLDALAALFEAVWERALPVATQGPGAPDDGTAALLTLLASGSTDEAIARALGMSPRTAQRRVQALMQQLGVATRFQAGVRARERGWV